MTDMPHPFLASAGLVAIAAAAGLIARELGFNENAWGIVIGLTTFFGCVAHEKLARR